jgi:hypothetical protein
MSGPGTIARGAAEEGGGGGGATGAQGMSSGAIRGKRWERRGGMYRLRTAMLITERQRQPLLIHRAGVVAAAAAEAEGLVGLGTTRGAA